MEAKERLSFYKSLIADGITLNGTQLTDMNQIVKERGGASAEKMPSGTIRRELARQKIG